MNNMNPPVYLIISHRFKTHSEAFYKELRKQVARHLDKMERLFLADEYEKAIGGMDYYLKFTLSGVNFSILRG